MRLTDVIRMAKDYLLLGITVVLFLALLFFAGYFLIYKKAMKGKKKITFRELAVIAILFCYVIVVLGATLGNRGDYYQGSVSLHPFSAYREAWNSFSITAWRNIILNILMFVPFGFLLPVLSKRFRKAWKTYLVGFMLTVGIECIQYFTGRGIFEIDDIIGNTIGTMIGYGLITFFIYVIGKLRNNTSIIGGRKAVLYQIPLLLTIVLFSSIFLTYSKQELGNISVAHSYQYNMSGIHVESDVSLSDLEGKAYVYKTKVGTKDETLSLANHLLKNLSAEVDERQSDYYDDTAVYKSTTGNYSVWIDYAGLTVWFNDHNQREGEMQKGYTLGEVIPILENYNIVLPREIDFEDQGNGKYILTADMEEFDGGFIDGALRCSITRDGTLSSFHNNLIQYEKYKEYEIISEQQAFENLRVGKFNHWHLHEKFEKPKSIDVKKVKLGHQLDTKGYYQPIYVFEILLNGEKTEIPMEALQQ
jgi:glycopeptide antibiotics resistance protein